MSEQAKEKGSGPIPNSLHAWQAQDRTRAKTWKQYEDLTISAYFFLNKSEKSAENIVNYSIFCLPQGHSRRLVGLLGASWGRLGGILGPLGALLGPLGDYLGPLGSVLGSLGSLLGTEEPMFLKNAENTINYSIFWPPQRGKECLSKRKREYSGPSWGHPGASWGLLGRSWGLLGPTWGLLEASWGLLEASWGLWSLFF